MEDRYSERKIIVKMVEITAYMGFNIMVGSRRMTSDRKGVVF